MRPAPSSEKPKSIHLRPIMTINGSSRASHQILPHYWLHWPAQQYETERRHHQQMSSISGTRAEGGESEASSHTGRLGSDQEKEISGRLPEIAKLEVCGESTKY